MTGLKETWGMGDIYGWLVNSYFSLWKKHFYFNMVNDDTRYIGDK